MSEKICDNKSVGVILTRGEDLLLIDRVKVPYGLACVAGHVDQHGSPLEACIAEASEEIGVTLSPAGVSLVLADFKPVNNACGRIGGDHHVWQVFEAALPDGEISMKLDEVSGHRFIARAALKELAEASALPATSPGQSILEPVWLQIFKELNYVS